MVPIVPGPAEVGQLLQELAPTAGGWSALGVFLMNAVGKQRVAQLEKEIESLPSNVKEAVLNEIKTNPDFQEFYRTAYFKAAMETRAEKIGFWKNAIGHVATDCKNISEKDIFLVILDELTVLDLYVFAAWYEPLSAEQLATRTSVDMQIVDAYKREMDPMHIRQAVERLKARYLIGGAMRGYESPGRYVSHADVQVYNGNEWGRKFFNFVKDFPAKEEK